MKTFTCCAFLFAAISFCGCHSKPSEEEISNKVLMEYVCNETARVTDLKIINTKETETIFGTPALQYTVSGEVEWPQGCNQFFGNLPPAYKETFQNKTVTFAKTVKGWE